MVFWKLASLKFKESNLPFQQFLTEISPKFMKYFSALLNKKGWMFLGFSDMLLISFLALWCNLVTSLRLVPPLSLNSPGLLLYKFVIDFAEVTVMSQRVNFAQGSSIPWHLITLNWLSGVLRKSWDWQDVQASKTRNRKSHVRSQTVDFGWMAWGQLLQAFMILEG